MRHVFAYGFAHCSPSVGVGAVLYPLWAGRMVRESPCNGGIYGGKYHG